MLAKPEDMKTVCSWTNGRMSVTHLLEDSLGRRLVQKAYHRGGMTSLVREFLITRYVSHRLPIVPRVIGIRLRRKELLLSYVPGTRVLEWVLERFGEEGVSMEAFRNFHGLDTNPVVAKAFAAFRQSSSEDASRLKHAITQSYADLHRIGILHNSADPRNIIFDGSQVFIIDFGHSRPSLEPAKIESKSLEHWFGVLPTRKGIQMANHVKTISVDRRDCKSGAEGA